MNQDCQQIPMEDATLPIQFQKAIDQRTKQAFLGRKMVTTMSGEVVLIEDVLEYNKKAIPPLASAMRKLASAGRQDTSAVIQDLYPSLMPYYIGCGTKNPVHHTAYVLEFMVTILINVDKTDRFNMNVGMLSALFHDVAQGLSKLPKITEDHIKDKIREVLRGQCTLGELEEFRDKAVAARKEHMIEGANIAEKLLDNYRNAHPAAVDDHEIVEIKRIIQHHDDPKIPVAYNLTREMFSDPSCAAWRSQLGGADKTHLDRLLSQSGDEYLLPPDDWLLQYHHEADLLWMVTKDGIDADLARFSPAQMKTARKMMKNNVATHHQEVDLYRKLPDFGAYDFRCHTPYRSRPGYELFKFYTGQFDASTGH